MNEENEYLALEDAARYLRASTEELWVILENYGFTSVMLNLIGKDITLRRGDLLGLRSLVSESGKSQGVA